MKEKLSLNCSKTDVEFSFNLSNKEDGFARATPKEKDLSEQNIRKTLNLNYMYFKLEYNILKKLHHFAVYRLNVNIFYKLLYIRFKLT